MMRRCDSDVLISQPELISSIRVRMFCGDRHRVPFNIRYQRGSCASNSDSPFCNRSRICYYSNTGFDSDYILQLG